ncbi:MAG: (2Fe-2S)-binding protein [Deltaproteobacteria bacterium]|nr:(2Fe-2S)-binding protein [Deltaproteobacteria bacterium]
MNDLLRLARRSVELSIDDEKVSVLEGSTILDATRSVGVDVPTLCFAENLTPINVCRVCVVEVEGARTLAPACSRKVEAGLKIKTSSPRVRTARKVVLELIASSVDVSESPEIAAMMKQYGAEPQRFGPSASKARAGDRDSALAGHHHATHGVAATVAEPPRVDNALFVRDYTKCMLCMKCVQACGADAQNTFAIAVAGRGFEARISTELALPLPDSACVFCGNCIGVCPTNALVFKTEYDSRLAGGWDESRQSRVDTICPYCGVGCTLTLHVQDKRIVKVTSPADSQVTGGHLCIKGRFGTAFVESKP